MKRNFDILIIGGGIFGASIFYHCLKNDKRQVALFEKNRFCHGATGSSGGLIKFLHGSKKLCTLSANSLKEFSNSEELGGIDCHFIKTGFFTVAQKQQFSEIQDRMQLLNHLGIHIECLNTTDFKLRFNHLHLPDDDQTIILYEKDSGYANPRQATEVYLSKGKSNGGVAFENIKVLDILTKNNRIIGVKTSYGIFKAPCVVLAAGAFSQELLKKLDIKTPKLNNKVIQVDFYQYPPNVSPIPSFIDKKLGLYGFDYGHNQCLLGTTIEYMPNRKHLSPKRTTLLEQLAVQRFPWITHQHWVGGRAEVDAYTDTEEGLLYFSSEVSGLFLCTGWSGVGFKMAPACGQEAAHQISTFFS